MVGSAQTRGRIYQIWRKRDDLLVRKLSTPAPLVEARRRFAADASPSERLLGKVYAGDLHRDQVYGQHLPKSDIV